MKILVNKEGISFILIIVLCTSGALIAEGSNHNLDKLASVEPYINRIVDIPDANVLEKVLKTNVKLGNNKMPFFHEEIEARKPWIVEYNNIVLKLKSAPLDSGDEYKRRLTVMVDPNSQQALRITLTRLDGKAYSRPDPSAFEAERQLLGIGEVYESFPDTEPNISFINALDAIYTRGVGNPFHAKEIEALYVIHSYKYKEPYPAWIITLKGIPPLPHFKGSNLSNEDRMRNVIDARTGTVLFATNVPAPIDNKDNN